MTVKSRIFLKAMTILVALLVTTSNFAQNRNLRVLVLVTSADHFADGRPTGLWLEEFAVPYGTLAKAGVEITVVSPKGGVAPVDPRSKGTVEQEKEWANSERALHSTVHLSPSIQARDFDAIFIPGGHGPLFDLATDPQVAKLISDFARSGKTVASVCHGPAAILGATLANGDPFVKGKRLTSFSDSEEIAAETANAVPFSVQQKLTSLGAQYSQGANFSAYAIEDGNLITGQNPGSSAKVAELLLKKLTAGKP